jgi:4-hydroxybenzoate polyprenyltransferase
MPSPMTLPAGVVGTNCLAMFTGKFATLLIAVAVISSIAPGPRMKRLTMWCDWSNSTAVSRQARCSWRQFENSDGTTG